MVESIISPNLDHLFLALADSTRRSILQQAAQTEMSIGAIAGYYHLTFAAISKHIKVLERAQLIRKERRGKEQIVMVVPAALQIAQEHLARYEAMWNSRFEQLDALLAADESRDRPSDKPTAAKKRKPHGKANR